MAILFFRAPTSAAQTLSDDDLTQIRFDQKLGTQVSLAMPFRDETGHDVHLSDYFAQKPVVLIMGYYECPMLCSLVLNGLLESAADLKWSIGKDFEVVDVSINPAETPSLAAAKKRSYLKRYGRSGAAGGWHFLTGSDAAIRQLSREVGFRYAYEPASKQYAHPSGLIILTPNGKISGYLFGVTYRSQDLYAALQRASSHQVGSPLQQFILLCFHYNPITGKYSSAIVGVLRLLSFGTVVGLTFLLVVLARRNRARTGSQPQPPSSPSTQQPPAPHPASTS